jgi:hypothetical protein
MIKLICNGDAMHKNDEVKQMREKYTLADMVALWAKNYTIEGEF